MCEGGECVGVRVRGECGCACEGECGCACEGECVGVHVKVSVWVCM